MTAQITNRFLPQLYYCRKKKKKNTSKGVNSEQNHKVEEIKKMTTTPKNPFLTYKQIEKE